MMAEKRNGTVKSIEYIPQNPFIHKLLWDDPVDKVKTILLTVILLPFRSICVIFLLVIAWLLAYLGLFGISKEELESKPLTGWRRAFRVMTAAAMRGMFVAGSFHRVKFIGVLARRKEAPIVVAAPHSSFFDAISAITMGPSSIVAKSETAEIPFFGKLIDFAQPIYVCRDDKNSRQKTLNDITERAKSDLDWSQILVFPEGTCTNRSSLIQFKQGAFTPGVPVQPILIRYPNKMDTVTWTWDGPEVTTLLWRTLTQFNTYCEVEFLPVYYPDENEKNNPILYAENVQRLMANALNVPASEYSYEDCKLMSFARRRRIPRACDLAVVQLLRKKLGLNEKSIEPDILRNFLINESNCYVGLTEFAKYLQLPADHPGVQALFNVFQDVKGLNEIDIREYLLCACYLITADQKRLNFIEYLFLLFGNQGEVNYHQFKKCMIHVPKLSPTEGDVLFVKVAEKTNTGHINYESLLAFVEGSREKFEDAYKNLC